MLLSILLLAGMSAATALPSRVFAAKLVGGFVYAFNPFVYIRLMAGHWLLLLGYAVLPWAVIAFTRMLERRSLSSMVLAAGAMALVGVFSVHMMILAAIVQAAAGIFWLVGRSPNLDRNALVKTTAVYGLMVLGLTAYWVLPVIASNPLH